MPNDVKMQSVFFGGNIPDTAGKALVKRIFGRYNIAIVDQYTNNIKMQVNTYGKDQNCVGICRQSALC